jgi:hypothetical protein
MAVGDDPRNAFHTLRRIPLVSSRTASLQPLPSCRYLPLHTVRATEVFRAAGRLVPKNIAWCMPKHVRAAAVWRSILASQVGVPVSVDLPRKSYRESPEASFGMP